MNNGDDINNLLRTLGHDAGDEVLIPSPDYPLHTAVVSLSGGTPVHYRCDEGSGWLPDLDDIRAKAEAAFKA